MVRLALRLASHWTVPRTFTHMGSLSENRLRSSREDCLKSRCRTGLESNFRFLAVVHGSDHHHL
jgi:hypothetical protein